MDRELIAWAAGIYEGEGTVAFALTNIYASVKMCDRDIVMRWGAAVGMGRCYGPYTRPGKQQWEWHIKTSADVVSLFEMFRPWLGERRIAQFEAVIARYEQRAVGQPPGAECGYYQEPTVCYRGYQGHLRRGESACQTCRTSMARYTNMRRKERLKASK